MFEPASSRVVPLPDAGEVFVGRGDEAGVRLRDPKVSRKHIALTLEPGGVRLTDLGSQNGTFVNGQRVHGSRPLGSGDSIEIGHTCLVLHTGGSEGERAPALAAREELDLDGSQVLLADPSMLALYALIRRLAKVSLPVLIHGETGTGKELAARALHHFSPRARARFVAINCAALPEALIESELFGHERGAFTGATQRKVGLFESATGGSVFLDEVAELPLGTQAKLLRALDTGRVVPVGAVDEHPIDVRVIAATHRNLEQEVGAGRFRQDLYYRLSGATLWLPPLRDRPRELGLIANRMLARARERLGLPPLRISESAWQALAAHPWPGNVRELSNVMEFLAATHEGAELDADAVLARLRSAAPVPAAAPAPTAERPSAGFRPLDDELRDLEQKRIVEALAAAAGNQTRAAELIGMPLRTFVSKLERYGLRGQKKS
ncbi:MAG: sigma 54-interacting transcriptional regulator [Myxococcales bacterium]|nr:sigma 54-interacting transcriptional regulator [Myxococcales bacterium]